MNPWIYVFLISLVILLMLLDRKGLSVNIYGGLIAASYKLVQNLLAKELELWEFYGVNWNLPPLGLFSDRLNIFTVGIAFTMGVLFLQFLPGNLYLQLVHSVIWTLLFVLFKYIMTVFDLLTYTNFSIVMSSHVLLFMLSLAWFKTYFLKSGFCR